MWSQRPAPLPYIYLSRLTMCMPFVHLKAVIIEPLIQPSTTQIPGTKWSSFFRLEQQTAFALDEGKYVISDSFTHIDVALCCPCLET